MNTEEVQMLAEIRESMGWGDESRNPLEDANAALQLAHALAADGWDMTHIQRAHQPDCLIKLEIGAGHSYRAFSATATGPHAFALALCRAYLSVIRAGKEQQG